MFFPLLLAFLFAPAQPQSAPDPPLPRAEDLIRRFNARMQQEDKAGVEKRYGFIEHSIQDELDKSGAVKQHNDRTYEVVEIDGLRVRQQIAADGKPLSAEQQQKVKERLAKALEERRKHPPKQKQDDDGDLQFDDRFMSHFRFTVIGREEINGRSAYVVTILPQPSNYAVRSNAEKVFTNMQGKVWIDAEQASLVRCDMHLAEPTTFYGVLGSIRQLDLYIQRKLVDGDAWLNERLNVTADGRRLFTSFHVRQQAEYSDFKRLAQQTADMHTGH